MNERTPAPREDDVAALQAAVARLQTANKARSGQVAVAAAFARELTAQAAAADTRAAQSAYDAGLLGEQVRELQNQAAARTAERDMQREALELTRRSTSWRVTAPLRWAIRQVQRAKGIVRPALSAPPSAATPPPIAAPVEPVPPALPLADRQEAIAREVFAAQQAELTPAEAASAVARLGVRPLISVIMPVYNTPVQWLRRAVESLQDQYYPHWELCAVDDCSPTSEQRDCLRALATADPRIRPQIMTRNGGISAASNQGLDAAQGEFVALLDHDDELTPDALLRMVEAIGREPDADFLYSDECRVDDTPAQELSHFIFKPDWSPELLLNLMLTGHLTLYRKSVVDAIGGFRSEYDFSQDYDLALRMAERARRIVHVERVLYLWRSVPGSAASGGKAFARDSNIAALNDALQRRDAPAFAIPLPHANYVRVAVPAGTLVSVVIPSDSAENLGLALQAIRSDTDYPRYEVLVVCNGPLADRLESDHTDWDRLRFVRYDRPYNFSDKCNEGARAARGDVVLFFNDDVFPLQRDWVERLIEYLWLPDVGGVSPKLLYPDDTIQYAGMVAGTPGLGGTAFNKLKHDTQSFLPMHNYVRDVSILSGACCALRREVFLALGGFDAVNTPDGHSDMDLSFRLREAGLRCVYTPHAVLRHIGNHSWGTGRKSKADIYVLRRHGAAVSRDPFFTGSMTRVLYDEFRFDYRIHATQSDPARVVTGPDVLFVSADLSLADPSVMLAQAAEAVHEAGGFAVVVSPADGALRHRLEAAGVVAIVDASVGTDHFLFPRFARNFDLAVVSGHALHAAAVQLAANGGLPTLLWLHDAAELPGPRSAAAGPHLVCTSSHLMGLLPAGTSASMLRYGLADLKGDVSPVRDRRFTFLIVADAAGTAEPAHVRQAIALLPKPVRADTRFLLLAGAGLPDGASPASELVGCGDGGFEDRLATIAAADAVVVVARDGSFPVALAAAAMLRKPIILGDGAVGGELFDASSCVHCTSADPAALAEAMAAVFERRDQAAAAAAAARLVYERALTLDVFRATVRALVTAHAVPATSAAIPGRA